MSDDNDAFDRAVRALRETGETSAAEVSSTRQRVLDTLHRGERRGRRTFWVLLPIAAVLAGGAAFAKDSDALRRGWSGLAEAVGIARPAEKSLPTPRPAKDIGEAAGPSNESAPARGALPEPTAIPDVVPPPPLATESATVLESERAEPGHDAVGRAARESAGVSAVPIDQRRPRRPVVADPASAPSASAPSAETVASDAPAASAATTAHGEAASLTLYKNAYRLHFINQRYEAALAAWDAYLRAAPAGSLVVEARYNRAIALVRLGRQKEAEAALLPFARGEIGGGYRVREAQQLLEALNGSRR